MQRHEYQIEIRRHAFIQASKRKITPDMVYTTIMGGKIRRYGKNGIKMIKRYKDCNVVCVGEISGMILKIITIARQDKRK